MDLDLCIYRSRVDTIQSQTVWIGKKELYVTLVVTMVVDVLDQVCNALSTLFGLGKKELYVTPVVAMVVDDS